MTKSVIIALIYFLVFSGFICNGFSIKLVKISQKVDLATWLASDTTSKGHMKSTCQKLKSQCVLWLISWLGQLMRWLAKCTDCWDFKCNSYTLHPYYICPHYPQNWRETI